MNTKSSINIFFAYSREDSSLRGRLDKHLSSLKRSKDIKTWFDGEIKPGEEWEKNIFSALGESDIILLLISADFISSDYCYDVEMKKAIARHENGEAIVIPVILSHCDWTETPFSKLQALPKDGVPIVDQKWYTEDQAMKDVAIGIRSIVTRKIKEREEQFSDFFQEIDSLREEKEKLNAELEKSRKKQAELKERMKQTSEVELLKAISNKDAQIQRQEITIRELKIALNENDIRASDVDASLKDKKAKIINTGQIYSTIDGRNEFKWRNEEIMFKAGKSEWKKTGFYPNNGMTGEIVDSFKHTDNNKLIYVLKIEDEYYVPIGAHGVELLK